MKTIKVFGFQQTAPNQFTFTGQELEKLLNKVYSEGYEEGYLSLTTNAAHTRLENNGYRCPLSKSIYRK